MKKKSVAVAFFFALWVSFIYFHTPESHSPERAVLGDILQDLYANKAESKAQDITLNLEGTLNGSNFNWSVKERVKASRLIELLHESGVPLSQKPIALRQDTLVLTFQSSVATFYVQITQKQLATSPSLQNLVKLFELYKK